MNLTVTLPKPHTRQREFIESPAKRKVIRAGRRSGKTTGVAIYSVNQFLAGRRILYAAPTQEQIDRFWTEVKRALADALTAGVFTKNETRHVIGLSGTEQRIRAKTAWDADTLRGDYADILILDEYQMMKPDAWRLVGAPMLLDNDGDAIFIYTERHGAKGKHARLLYQKAEQDDTGRWAAFRFTSHDNPHISREALADITYDMTQLAYRMEILAEEIEDNPDALWERVVLETNRVTSHPQLDRIVVGVDPPGTEEGAECGIVTTGAARIDNVMHGYVLADDSLRGLPARWAGQVVATYNRLEADRIVGEVNHGGDMVEHTVRTAEGGDLVSYKAVRASRGKAIRAEPVAALYQRGLIHHVGTFGELEDQQCGWQPGDTSPDRLDALVWALTELMLGEEKKQARARAIT